MLKRLRPPFGFLKKKPLPTTSNNPTRGSEVPYYFDSFAACARFSQSVCPGLEAMTIKPTSESSSRLIPELERVVMHNKITADDYRAAAAQCLKWVHFLAPHVASATGLACWPTIGQLWKGDDKVWGPTWDDLRSMVQNGIHPGHLMKDDANGLSLHGWLTLETGEIIDPTLCSSLAVIQGGPYEQMLGMIVLGQEPEVISDHRYFPMLAGAQAFELMQSRSSLPFLAADREDLSRGPGMVIAF